MNIPSTYRKAVDGFIIPPRTFWQMAVSAVEGTFSLFEQSNRAEFIENLDRGTINEGVISQATAGPFIMLSLFNDLQSPHFKKNQFNPKEFLDGVGGALANFHNVTGAFENEIQKMVTELEEEDDDDDDKKKDEKNGEEEENKSEDSAEAAALSALGIQPLGLLTSQRKGFAKILEHTWLDDAQNDSDSLAGQLSRMTTKELFQIHENSLKFHSLLQDHSRGIQFKEGSCSVNNVALLSARAFVCREIMKEDSKEEDDDDELFHSISGPRYEMVEEVDDDGGESSSDKNGVGVAAQMEVLYDVTQEFIQTKPLASSSTTTTTTTSDNQGDKNEAVSSNNNNDGPADEIVKTTMVSVATLEGWLTGGPDGELRWKLALYRPAFEFPGFQQSY